RAVECALVGDAGEGVVFPATAEGVNEEQNEAQGEHAHVAACDEADDDEEHGNRNPGVAEDAFLAFLKQQPARRGHILKAGNGATHKLPRHPSARLLLAAPLTTLNYDRTGFSSHQSSRTQLENGPSNPTNLHSLISNLPLYNSVFRRSSLNRHRNRVHNFANDIFGATAAQ